MLNSFYNSMLVVFFTQSLAGTARSVLGLESKVRLYPIITKRWWRTVSRYRASLFSEKRCPSWTKPLFAIASYCLIRSSSRLTIVKSWCEQRHTIQHLNSTQERCFLSIHSELTMRAPNQINSPFSNVIANIFLFLFPFIFPLSSRYLQTNARIRFSG